MSHLDCIKETLDRTAKRRRWLRAWRGFGMGVFWGAVAWLLALGLYKLFPVPPETIPAAAILALAAAVVGALAGYWRKMTPLETARWLDEQSQLKERLSTAVEINSDHRSEHWENLVLADAAKHAKDVDHRRLLPFNIPVLTRWALGLLVLGVGLGFVPEYRSESYKRAKVEAAQIREVGKQLAQLTRRNLETRPPLLPPVQQSLEDLVRLGHTMTKAKLTRTDALRKLTSAMSKLEEQSRAVANNPTLKALERSARQPGMTAPSPSEQGLQNQMDALQKAMGQTTRDPQKLDDLQQKLQKLRQSASQLSSQNSDQAEAARQQLSQALSQLSQEAKDMGASLPGLEEAIAALQNNQTDLMLRDLQAAMHDLDKLKGMAKAMQQMQQQMTRLGKDLAEQLEQGQVQAAKNTLETMEKKLRQSGLAPDQMQKIMQEVVKAVDPAGEYGQVADHLQKAVQQMKQGQNDGAAQCLADAAKELEKMRQQLQDAQSLMAAMQALDRAQQALASGKSWEECQGGYCQACGGVGCSACGRKKGTSWGHGKGFGPGVGTWADDTGWSYLPKEQVPVDNSGVVRPDMDARGISDRPDDLNSNLRATKVRGQVAPGRSMPSITLKGVHLKGESKVEYEEAVSAAQADAQSALSQDKVPRPYVNAVKDYFDDLK